MRINEKKSLLNVIYSALFLGIGMVLPLFTAQIKQIGNMLLPMHLPVLLCGFICGWKYGLTIGFILPFLRSFVFGMPPVFPNGVWMAAELATYGFMAGFLYPKYKKEKLFWIYTTLILSMIAGRIVWAIVKSVLLGINGEVFTFQAFIAGGFLNAIPGIVSQLVIIPAILHVKSKRH